jgi:GH24 family phage-related lysozyme (muramidase)
MKSFFNVSGLVFVASLAAAGQTVQPALPTPVAPTQAPMQVAPALPGQTGAAAPVTIPGAIARASEEAAALPDAVQTLMDFKASDVKFDVADLMDILRDKRHEGWVLAAYPDPKTGQPLIGAGFSLDLPERIHIQHDPLNPHPFLEPSSADLWQAAGLEPARLDGILAQFNDRMDAWSKKGFRRQIWSLEPQITEADANALLRIGIVQAIYNAKAYCRSFERLGASQQMAMTQLVYQMGVNLEEFSTFLTLLNRENGNGQAAIAQADAQYWHEVQLSLVQSQWARLYRERAKAVIAMLDPSYAINPSGAEHSVSKVLRPAHTRRAHGTTTLRKASYTTKHHGSAARKRAARTRKD